MGASVETTLRYFCYIFTSQYQRLKQNNSTRHRRTVQDLLETMIKTLTITTRQQSFQVSLACVMFHNSFHCATLSGITQNIDSTVECVGMWNGITRNHDAEEWIGLTCYTLKISDEWVVLMADQHERPLKTNNWCTIKEQTIIQCMTDRHCSPLE